MKNFNITTIAKYFDAQEMEVMIRSFSEFYHSVTPKHQKRLFFSIIIDENVDVDVIKNKIEVNEIAHKVKVINEEDMTARMKALHDASIFHYPSSKQISKVLPEALSYNLPILTYENDDPINYVDITCGMKILNRSTEDAIYEFARLMEMIYFDPEVLQLLIKGAEENYQENFSWGMGSRRNV